MTTGDLRNRLYTVRIKSILLNLANHYTTCYEFYNITMNSSLIGPLKTCDFKEIKAFHSAVDSRKLTNKVSLTKNNVTKVLKFK